LLMCEWFASEFYSKTNDVEHEFTLMMDRLKDLQISFSTQASRI
jgi:hypothetical protein